MTLERLGVRMFTINAFINWTLALPGIIAPGATAARYGVGDLDMPFLIRLWTGLVFMFGIMFWETSRDLRGRQSLVKYNWIEKTITATAVTIGFAAGEVPGRLLLLIVMTNWLWIPGLLAFDIAWRRRVARDSRIGRAAAMAPA